MNRVGKLSRRVLRLLPVAGCIGNHLLHLDHCTVVPQQDGALFEAIRAAL